MATASLLTTARSPSLTGRFGWRAGTDHSYLSYSSSPDLNTPAEDKNLIIDVYDCRLQTTDRHRPLLIIQLVECSTITAEGTQCTTTI